MNSRRTEINYNRIKRLSLIENSGNEINLQQSIAFAIFCKEPFSPFKF